MKTVARLIAFFIMSILTVLPRMAPPRPHRLQLVGGLDTEAPPQSAPPGSLIGAENYLPLVGGGYERIGGCERFDGRAKPSDAQIIVLGSAIGRTAFVPKNAPTPTPWQWTGQTSGATGWSIWASDQELAIADQTNNPDPDYRVALTDLVGTFIHGEEIRATVGGAVLFSSVIVENGGISTEDLNAAMAAAEARYRALVGSRGSLKGICVVGSTVFSFANDGAGSCDVRISSGTGWAVPTNIITSMPKFTNANGVAVRGATIEAWNGGVLAGTGTVIRLLSEGGDYSASAGVGGVAVQWTSGGYSVGNVLKIGGGVTFQATVSSSINSVLPENGKWRFVQARFASVDVDTSTTVAYGVSGNTGDPQGDVLVELDSLGNVIVITGLSIANKVMSSIMVHAGHLMIASGNQFYFSAPGQPYNFRVIDGAGQIAYTAEIVDTVAVPGSPDNPATMIQARDSFAVLYGKSKSLFNFVPMSDQVGFLAWSAQPIGGGVALDTNGVRSFAPTSSFGNFSSKTLTRHILKQVANLPVVGSAVERDADRYWLFLSDGRILVGCPGKRWQWTWCRLPEGLIPHCVASGELNGEWVILIGGADGYVRMMQRGRSFDGATIEAWLKTSYDSLGSPRVHKTIGGIELEVTALGHSTIDYRADFNYQRDSSKDGARVTVSIEPTGSAWNLGAWNTGAWNSAFSRLIPVAGGGAGENMASAIYSVSDEELPHRIHAVHTRVRARRIAR